MAIQAPIKTGGDDLDDYLDLDPDLIASSDAESSTSTFAARLEDEDEFEETDVNEEFDSAHDGERVDIGNEDTTGPRRQTATTVKRKAEELDEDQRKAEQKKRKKDKEKERKARVRTLAVFSSNQQVSESNGPSGRESARKMQQKRHIRRFSPRLS
jgi:protein CMS1